MGSLLLELFNSFGPVVLGLIKRWQEEHRTTELPTLEELTRDYQAEIDGYLAEGAAWRAAHPDA